MIIKFTNIRLNKGYYKDTYKQANVGECHLTNNKLSMTVTLPLGLCKTMNKGKKIKT